MPYVQFIGLLTIATLVGGQLSLHADVLSPTSTLVLRDASGANSHRNERSTPRNSVLPASPATAPYHTRRQEPVSVELAKAVLLSLGYEVGRLDNRVTAKFKAALFHYQQTNGLPSSGIIDQPTGRSLGIVEE